MEGPVDSYTVSLCLVLLDVSDYEAAAVIGVLPPRCWRHDPLESLTSINMSQQ